MPAKPKTKKIPKPKFCGRSTVINRCRIDPKSTAHLSVCERNITTRRCRYTGPKEHRPTARELNAALPPRKKIQAIARIRQLPTGLGAFIKANCPDTTLCMSMGEFYTPVRTLFANFQNFNHLITRSQIGEKSTNGTVEELIFEKDGVTAHITLKTSLRSISDNLMYEYKVGQYINQFTLRFPCFVYTHTLFYGTRPYPHISDWSLACQFPTKLHLATQYFDNVIPFHHLLRLYDRMLKTQPEVSKQILVDIYQILFQVYFPLSCISSKFTHYDLHAKNVLLYLPFGQQKKCIQMTYTNKGKVVRTFRTQYIAKIIDYGRSYYEHGPKEIKKICETCNHCGRLSGFSFITRQLYGEKTNTEIIWKTHGHINPMVSNPTHDLRLLNIVSAKIPLKGASLPPSEMNGFVDHSMSPPYNPTTQKQINTVADVITWLTTAVSDKWTQEKSSYSDSSYKVYGHMTIDSEAETFTYEPVTD